jgi:hypothetical protein
MVDALTGPYLGQDLRLLVLPVGRNQEHDRPADNLIPLVAKQTLRAIIPSLDDAIEILADDRIG